MSRKEWNGGEMKKYGYVYVLKPGHPRASNRDNYVKRSVLVVEKELDRDLEPGEIVHHINGIKDDDRPENLQVMTSKAAHAKLHNTGFFHAVYKKDLNIDLIRKEYRNGASSRKLALKYGCSHPTIMSCIPAGKRRKSRGVRKNLDNNLIRKEYRNGVGGKELALKYGCSLPTIMSRIPVGERRRSGQKKKDIDIQEARRLREGGMSYQKIADVFGVSRLVIRKRLIEEKR